MQDTDTNKQASLQAIAKGPDLAAKLARYHLGLIEKSAPSLSAYASEENAVLADLARLVAAYSYLKKHDNKALKEELRKIPFDSSLNENVRLFGHFGDMK